MIENLKGYDANLPVFVRSEIFYIPFRHIGKSYIQEHNILNDSTGNHRYIARFTDSIQGCGIKCILLGGNTNL